jgi:hypothetical protein
LGDSGDLEELVFKWLSKPVGMYLLEGSPDEDYSQDASKFYKSWQADVDLGQNDKPYLGVRMIDTRNDGSHERHWFLRYSVLHFGGRCSPYIAGVGQLRILELCKGHPKDPKLRFGWERVHLNLPTSTAWDPSLPRVLLLRKDQEMASQEVNYVDDIHPVSWAIDEVNAVLDAKQLRSRMNSLGNQADDKKYRRPTCRPGAWKGEIMHTDQPFPRKSTTGKKWSHFRAPTVPTAELRRIAGLGVNVTDVYREARCFLKGFFNAVEAFRPDRDANAWRIKEGFEGPLAPELGDNYGLTEVEFEEVAAGARELEDSDAPTATAQAGYPPLTKITSELLAHAEVLLEYFNTNEPRAVYIRPTLASKYRYYIGDASREGFGGATQFQDRSI